MPLNTWAKRCTKRFIQRLTVFFFERNISGVSHLDKFYSKKRKTFAANDLLAPSLVSKLFYTYSLGKKIIVHI